MAFEIKYKNKDGEICPICRRQFKDGRRITAYGAYKTGTDIMCKSCFNSYYKNKKSGFDAALSDDTANLFTALRPAPVLERSVMMKTEPECGYEYRMPELPEHLILQDAAVWLLMCLVMKIALKIGRVPEDGFAVALLSVYISIGSGVWLIINLWKLIKGIFLGMGYKRRLLLTAVIIIMAFLIKTCFPS